MKILNARIKTKNTKQNSWINCDFVEMKENHLFFYLGKKLVFKVWLEKKYKRIEDASRDVGVSII